VREEIHGLRSCIPARICAHILSPLAPSSSRDAATCAGEFSCIVVRVYVAAASHLPSPPSVPPSRRVSNRGAAERVSFACHSTAIGKRKKLQTTDSRGGVGGNIACRAFARMFTAPARRQCDDDGVIALQTFKGRPDSVAIKMHIDPTRAAVSPPSLRRGTVVPCINISRRVSHAECKRYQGTYFNPPRATSDLAGSACGIHVDGGM